MLHLYYNPCSNIDIFAKYLAIEPTLPVTSTLSLSLSTILSDMYGNEFGPTKYSIPLEDTEISPKPKSDAPTNHKPKEDSVSVKPICPDAQNILLQRTLLVSVDTPREYMA